MGMRLEVGSKRENRGGEGSQGWVEVVEGDEGGWEGRLCEVVGGERVGVPGVQKPPFQGAAAATDEEGVLTGARRG